MNEKREPVSGDPAPDFCLPDQNDEKVCLGDLKGRWTVLYFYPKDNTSGCTLEATDFTAKAADFKNMGAFVVGVSPDSTKSHRSFIEKKELNLRLLSDESHGTLEAYGVWKLKKMYGREYMGVVRSTFIVDPDGKIAGVWSKVKVKGHVEEVLGTLGELTGRTREP